MTNTRNDGIYVLALGPNRLTVHVCPTKREAARQRLCGNVALTMAELDHYTAMVADVMHVLDGIVIDVRKV